MIEILRLAGKGIQIGDMEADDLAKMAGRPAFSIRLADGRTVVLIGLSRDEARACMPGFLERATIMVSAEKKECAKPEGSES